LFIEKSIRHRSWETLGFKFKNTVTDIKQNGYLILLVGFIIPILTVVISNLFLPEFFDYLKARVPVFKPSLIVPLFLSFLIGGFIEESIFRGLFQERLSWFLGTPAVLTLSALVFSIAHFISDSFALICVIFFTSEL
jgi:membrane protease YdiL (CAAX protease family)